MENNTEIQDSRPGLCPFNLVNISPIAQTNTRTPLMPSDCPTSVLNFRDFAQVPNAEFEEHEVNIREGCIYRSAETDDITDQDASLLQGSYGIKTVVDLRYGSKNQLKEDGKLHGQHYPSMPGALHFINLTGTHYRIRLILRLVFRLKWIAFVKMMWFVLTGQKPRAIPIVGAHAIKPGGLQGLAIDTLKSSRRDFKKIFHLLAEKSNYPIHFYCQQGKDRTGITIILLLLLLEVPRKAIHKDYMRSEEMLRVIENETEEEFRLKGLPREFALCDSHLVDWVVEWLWVKYHGVGGYLTSIGVGEDIQARIQQQLRPEAFSSKPPSLDIRQSLSQKSSSTGLSSAASLDEMRSSGPVPSTTSRERLLDDHDR